MMVLVEERDRLLLELETRLIDFRSLKRNLLVGLVQFMVRVHEVDSALLVERMGEISRLESQLVSAESGVLVLPLLLCVEEDAAADSGVRCSQVESQHSETQTMTEDFAYTLGTFGSTRNFAGHGGSVFSCLDSLKTEVGEVRKCLLDLTSLRAPYAREIQGSGTPRGSFYAAGIP